MADLFARIQEALAGTYVVEREIGRGGMAQVFLARDTRHGRLVAVKVFLPEVAEGLGKGRFLREIKTAANLSDPRILPLFDSGDNGGLLYYMMPFVDGLSLAERIAAEGPLPIDEALTIARNVAMALQHAHSRGVVHRDIKPGNILLSGTNVFVADFGIAHALEETGQEKLTSTGFAVGTPAYMSPEQSGGYGQIDGRADIYSLGCVLFEMLAGEPPFSGRSSHAILARHSVERVPSVRAVRDTVPWAVEQAIHKALAKTPADRFASAEDFAAALAPDRITAPIPVVRPRQRLAWKAVALVVAIVGLALAFAQAPWTRWMSRGPETAIAVDRVAVMPFGTGGASDPGLDRLVPTIDRLIAERLPGEGGPQAVFAGTVAAAVAKAAPGVGRGLTEAEALRVARSVGAGLVLIGQISGVGDRITIGATLKESRTGNDVARAPNLSAPADSLPALLDRLVAALLVGATRQPLGDRDDLSRRSLPALRAFLEGRRAVARGQVEAAALKFSEALRSDSTFVRAALGIATIGRFVHDSVEEKGIALTRARATLLSPLDRLYLEAVAGQRPGLRPGIPERLAAWEKAVDHDTSRVEGWYQLGEVLFHDGPFTGATDVLQRAANAFRRALRIEPAFVPALGHLLDLAASTGDTAAVRELADRYFAIDSAGELTEYYRWRAAVALGNQPELVRIRARIETLGKAALERMVNVSQLDGVALEDGARAAASLWSRGGLSAETRWGFSKLREIALNRGQPAEAASITRRRMQTIPLRPRDRLAEVVDALYWGADTLLASEVVRDQARGTDARLLLQPPAADSVYYDVCAVNLWRISRGDLAPVSRAIAALRRIPEAMAQPQTVYIRVCADLLDAQLAAAAGRADARARLVSLDSLARTAPPSYTWVLAATNLSAARLWEAAGDLTRALAATRRRLYITDIGEPRVLAAHSSFLREEGRLAARTGDRTGAMQAYEKYLALRANAEPSVAAEVRAVQSALDTLQRQP